MRSYFHDKGCRIYLLSYMMMIINHRSFFLCRIRTLTSGTYVFFEYRICNWVPYILIGLNISFLSVRLLGKTWHNPVLHVSTRLPVGWFWSWPSSSLHTPSTLPGWPAKPTPLLRSSCRLAAATAAASSLMTSERPTTGSATTPPRSVTPEEMKDRFWRKCTMDVLSHSGFIMRSQDAKVMSWWDYGYQITAMANRTILVDNNTWNNTHISRVGQVSRLTLLLLCW